MAAAATAALVSFRLGGTDGVSVVAATWARALTTLGWRVVTVAGEGPVDRRVPGLAWAAPSPPPPGELVDALADVDLVVVENLCSLPLRPDTTGVVVDVLRGRPTVLHHHDLPWQRHRFTHVTGWPAGDTAWRHVTISDLSRTQLAERGIEAATIRNAFDTDEPAGDRAATRDALGVAPDETLVMHPVRAIARKNVPAAIAMAEALDATYWLSGPAEEDYAPVLAQLLRHAPVRVIHRRAPSSMADAYAAADVVVFPSTWEGFGNPLIESAIHRRPLAVSDYPVAREIGAFGFRWFPVDDPGPLRRWRAAPDEALLDHNRQLARRHFSLSCLVADLDRHLEAWGWSSG